MGKGNSPLKKKFDKPKERTMKDPLAQKELLVELEDDEVTHPPHYTQGKIEVIDFLIDQDMNFMAANVVKYTCRYRFKGNPVQDLKKARFYLDRLIKEVEIAQPDPRCKSFGVEATGPRSFSIPEWTKFSDED